MNEIHRAFTNELKARLEEPDALIQAVLGPRQVGKTTLLQKLAGPERKYVSLDDPNIRELAVKEPSLFLQRYTPPLLIDEIQYAPPLMPYIKMYVDQHKGKGSFWLTGSQLFHVMKGVSESLAGRVGLLNLAGLTNSEISGTYYTEFTTDAQSLMKRLDSAKPLQLMEIYQHIYKGSMPALYETDSLNIEQFYSSYIQTYIQRDIKDLTQVADELSFYQFLRVAAARTGSMVN